MQPFVLDESTFTTLRSIDRNLLSDICVFIDDNDNVLEHDVRVAEIVARTERGTLDLLQSINVFYELSDLKRFAKDIFDSHVELVVSSLIHAPENIKEILSLVCMIPNPSEELVKALKLLKAHRLQEEINLLDKQLELDLLSIAEIAPIEIVRDNFIAAKISKACQDKSGLIGEYLTSSVVIDLSFKRSRDAWNSFLSKATTELLGNSYYADEALVLLEKFNSNSSFQFSQTHGTDKKLPLSHKQSLRKLSDIYCQNVCEVLKLEDLKVLSFSLVNKDWDSKLVVDASVGFLHQFLLSGTNLKVHNDVVTQLLDLVSKRHNYCSANQRKVVNDAYQALLEINNNQLPLYLSFLILARDAAQIFIQVERYQMPKDGVPFFIAEAVAIAHLIQGSPDNCKKILTTLVMASPNTYELLTKRSKLFQGSLGSPYNRILKGLSKIHNGTLDKTQESADKKVKVIPRGKKALLEDNKTQLMPSQNKQVNETKLSPADHEPKPKLTRKNQSKQNQNRKTGASNYKSVSL